MHDVSLRLQPEPNNRPSTNTTSLLDPQTCRFSVEVMVPEVHVPEVATVAMT